MACMDVGLAGFEPATSPLSGVRSNRLSYSPVDPGTVSEPVKALLLALARVRCLADSASRSLEENVTPAQPTLPNRCLLLNHREANSPS